MANDVYGGSCGTATGNMPIDKGDIGEIRRMVAAVVAAHGQMAARRALDVAADSLGLGCRRARAFYHGEVRRSRAGEVERVREGYGLWLRSHVRGLARELMDLTGTVA